MNSTSSSAQNEPSTKGLWSALAPFVVPPTAACMAMPFCFRDFIGKSALQLGLPLPKVTMLRAMEQGVGTARTLGTLVGVQVLFQDKFEKALVEEGKCSVAAAKLGSAAAVGFLSSPLLAVFNGKTLKQDWKTSLRKFTPRQCAAITLGETGFVGGLAVGDSLAAAMKQQLGDNKVVEYFAAFTAGVLGSLAGHPGNTALTRWQVEGMRFDVMKHSMLGAALRARAIGSFSLVYKLMKDLLFSTVDKSE